MEAHVKLAKSSAGKVSRLLAHSGQRRVRDKLNHPGAHPITWRAHPYILCKHDVPVFHHRAFDAAIATFVDLLTHVEVQLVVDVRTVPRSHTNPQYNSEILSKMLSQYQIEYEHIAALGGVRGRKKDVPADVNAFWLNQSFHNYADYAMSEDFHSGFIRLRELGHTKRCAIICAEVVWWRCHRRIIADYLIAAGEKVFHILGRDYAFTPLNWHIERCSTAMWRRSSRASCSSQSSIGLGGCRSTAYPFLKSIPGIELHRLPIKSMVEDYVHRVSYQNTHCACSPQRLRNMAMIPTCANDR